MTRAQPGGGLALGILTPVLTLTAGRRGGWELNGTLADVERVAKAADRLGYDHLTCSEHVAVPEAAVDARGSRYWDPLATFGYLAAVTQSVRFTTDVLVLGYHHPLEIAKRYGTLDRVCGGRLVLGLGIGSLREEFELLDRPFADRGARADDALKALRAALSVPVPSYTGPFYRFGGMVIDPCAQQVRVPLWIGGSGARSLRRAVELGDGWCPFNLGPAEANELLTAASRTPAWQARETPLHVVLQTARPVDPVAAPEEAAKAARALREAGASTLSLRFVHRSVEHYLEQMEAMVAVVAGLDD